ncbi:MAG: hypothetical protein Q4F17_09985 [Eubacteriales bacterium]|nr:hypothetical protein [Eubacteriales bacterium]
MNNQDLLDVIGEARDQYVLRAEASGRKKARLSLRKPMFLAALIAVAMVLAGCVAVVMGLQQKKVSELSETKQFNEYGRRIEPTEVTLSVFTPYGGEAVQQATKEWYAFTDSYDPDHKLMPNTNENNIPENYYYTYDCYTQDMVDKLDEIVQKYNLKLLDKFTVAQAWEKQVMLDTLGIDGVTRPEAQAKIKEGAGVLFPNGNFRSTVDVTLTSEDAKWTNPCYAEYFYAKNDTFAPDVGFVMEEGYDQWEYTTADGTDVLIARTKEGDGNIVADLGDATVYISLDPDFGLPRVREESQMAGKEVLEQLADVFDYHVKPQAFDREQLAADLAIADAEYEAAQPVYEEPVFDSYGQLLNSGLTYNYRPWLEDLYYCLYDLDGNGVEDLLLGEGDGSFCDAYTMEDGQVTLLLSASGSRNWVCEDSVLHCEADYPYPKTTQHSFRTFRFENGEFMTDETLDFMTRKGDKWRSGEWDNVKEITEEEAQAIISKYPHLDLDFQPVLDYPMEHEGMTLGQYIRENDPVLTTEEIHKLYSDMAVEYYEKDMAVSYAYRDVNGDGQEDLLLAQADGQCNVMTVYRGKVLSLYISGWLCEGNVFERQDYTDHGLMPPNAGQYMTYLYEKLDGHDYQVLDYVTQCLNDDRWHTYIGEPEIPESQAQEILAKYPRIQLDLKPISDLVN